MILKKVLLFCVIIQVSYMDKKCEERSYDFDSIVCVCNSTYCDTVDPPSKLNSSQFYVYTSNSQGLRFKKDVGSFTSSSLYLNGVIIDKTQKFQSILGFGGAFTDSTGINIASLDNKTQDNLLKSYFSTSGIEYNLCRVPIGGTDFSTREYTYDDGPPDTELKNFNLQPEDHQYKIPYMKKALHLQQESLSFFGSAWSAPNWMKISEDSTGYFSRLKPNVYQIWADYHKKFVEEYQKQGLKMWGVTTGNEPATAFISYIDINRLGWTTDLMRKFLTENFGPTMRKHYPDIKIITLDDQRFLLPWVAQFLITPNTTEFIDGLGIHWYFDEKFSSELINDTHSLYPDKFILSTEGSIIDKNPPVALGLWYRGEKYSTDIIEDLSNWVVGWVDWNMVLDLDGGPTWKNNYLDAAIIVNATSGEFYKQPVYYHIGHFSKFIHKGSKRIFSKTDCTDNFDVIAFERPDNAIVIVILNKSNNTVPITIFDNDNRAAKIAISKRSINTIIYW